jgi:hypothetical protein
MFHFESYKFNNNNKTKKLSTSHIAFVHPNFCNNVSPFIATFLKSIKEKNEKNYLLFNLVNSTSHPTNNNKNKKQNTKTLPL